MVMSDCITWLTSQCLSCLQLPNYVGRTNRTKSLLQRGRFNSTFSRTPSLNFCFYPFLNSPKTHWSCSLSVTLLCDKIRQEDSFLTVPKNGFCSGDKHRPYFSDLVFPNSSLSVLAQSTVLIFLLTLPIFLSTAPPLQQTTTISTPHTPSPSSEILLCYCIITLTENQG